MSNGASSVATYAPILLQCYVLCVSQQVSQTAQQGGVFDELEPPSVGG